MLKQLFPIQQELPLQGVYLALNLHQQAQQGDVFIYANYIVSLDGRIALFDEVMGEYAVPKSIANGRDWRLYQELAGQADVMLTSARYFRQLAEDKAQDLLPVGSGEKYADIKAWREKQGLKAQPDVMVLSNSLNIPLKALAKVQDRQVIVLTSSQDKSKIETLENAGAQVISVMSSAIETSRDPSTSLRVTGGFVRQSLIDLKYRSAYLIAGPQVHSTLMADSCVDELFLTTHFTLLGGTKVSGLVDVDLPQAQSMKLLSAYLDTQDNQMFQRFSYVG
ncbi:MAG: pyrimidine reductase [Zetaproteobacteria bacterium]|nr:MAG: pyrimidine reductase [Zetaproteobacteria bacterium]